VVSTRPLNLAEEAERSARLSGSSARGWSGRVTLLDAARGDLDELVQYGETPSGMLLGRREAAPRWAADQEPSRAPAHAGDGHGPGQSANPSSHERGGARP
jgi:hypothetical protein